MMFFVMIILTYSLSVSVYSASSLDKNKCLTAISQQPTETKSQNMSKELLAKLSNHLFRYKSFSVWQLGANLRFNTKGEVLYYDTKSKQLFLGNEFDLDFEGADWSKGVMKNMDYYFSNKKQPQISVDTNNMKHISESIISDFLKEKSVAHEANSSSNAQPLKKAIIKGNTFDFGVNPSRSTYESVNWENYYGKMISAKYGSKKVIQKVIRKADLATNNQKTILDAIESLRTTGSALDRYNERGIWVINTDQGPIYSQVFGESGMSRLSTKDVSSAFNRMMREHVSKIPEDAEIKEVTLLHTHPVSGSPLSPADGQVFDELSRHSIFSSAKKGFLKMMAVGPNKNSPIFIFE